MHPIERKRKALGLTQEQLAKRLGVTKAAVSRWENGGGADSGVFPKLARVFDMSPEEVTHLFDPVETVAAPAA